MTARLSPPPLKQGDRLAIVAPAGRISDTKRFFKGVAMLKEMGFKVVFPKDLWPGKEYLADTDENRASEFNRLLGDPEIKALIALRGGYGCLRMIEKIDLALVVRHPKLIIGFSDLTILQNYLYQKTSLISLHGPVVTSLANTSQPALDAFYRCLIGGWDKPITLKKIEILRERPVVRAPLLGGNLASLVSLLGTPHDFSWDNSIIVLEDINEPAYKVDRMLTQLYLAGKFNKLAGLIIGDFSGLHPENSTEHIRYLEIIWTRVLELCDKGDFPVWGNFPCGHCPHSVTLPLGALAEMHSDKATLTFPGAGGQI